MSNDPIYVLGVGNLGKYVAHSLMKQTCRGVILLFHRPGLEEQWRSAASSIQCVTDGVPDKRSGFGVEVLPPLSQSPSKNHSTHGVLEPIMYLIVATKTYMTTNALKLVKDRLHSESSILFLQNGMGIFTPSSDDQDAVTAQNAMVQCLIIRAPGIAKSSG